METKYWKSTGKVRKICQSENVGTMVNTTGLKVIYP